MHIMAISDLHGNLEGLDPKDADVVVLAGDIAPLKGRGVWHVNDQKKWINKKFRELGNAYYKKVKTEEVIDLESIIAEIDNLYAEIEKVKADDCEECCEETECCETEETCCETVEAEVTEE